MTRKQREAKKAANNVKVRFIELMGYDVQLVGVPKTWAECIARFK